MRAARELEVLLHRRAQGIQQAPRVAIVAERVPLPAHDEHRAADRPEVVARRARGPHGGDVRRRAVGSLHGVGRARRALRIGREVGRRPFVHVVVGEHGRRPAGTSSMKRRYCCQTVSRRQASRGAAISEPVRGAMARTGRGASRAPDFPLRRVPRPASPTSARSRSRARRRCARRYARGRGAPGARLPRRRPPAPRRPRRRPSPPDARIRRSPQSPVPTRCSSPRSTHRPTTRRRSERRSTARREQWRRARRARLRPVGPWRAARPGAAPARPRAVSRSLRLHVLEEGALLAQDEALLPAPSRSWRALSGSALAAARGRPRRRRGCRSRSGPRRRRSCPRAAGSSRAGRRRSAG